MTERSFSNDELMTVALARELRDGEVGMTGANSTIPVAASLLAQQLHAPDLTLILPSGVVNPLPGRLYRSASDGRWAVGAEAIGSAYDLFELSENGMLDFMFYGGVQIDRRGNINLTRTGPADGPPRFRGPGLANISFAVVCGRILLYSSVHSERTFVERVDYLTAPGHLEGGDSRRAAGIDTQGPVYCITPLAAMEFDDLRRLQVRTVHPGVAEATVKARTGFALDGADWPTTEPPSPEELRVLRNVVDRTGELRRSSLPVAAPSAGEAQ